jgi:hypothetical protein
MNVSSPGILSKNINVKSHLINGKYLRRKGNKNNTLTRNSLKTYCFMFILFCLVLCRHLSQTKRLSPTVDWARSTLSRADRHKHGGWRTDRGSPYRRRLLHACSNWILYTPTVWPACVEFCFCDIHLPYFNTPAVYLMLKTNSFT